MSPIPNTVLQASAGTGKTHQVTTLLQALLLGVPYPATGRDPAGLPAGGVFDPATTAVPRCEDILVLTFARNAAAEMRERITAAIERELAAAPPEQQARYWDLLRSLAGADISTIHSFAQRLLSAHALRVGLSPSFMVLDEDSSVTLCREVAEAALLESLTPGHALAEPLAALCHGHTAGELAGEIVEFIRRCSTLGCGTDPATLRALAEAPGWPDGAVLPALAKRIASAAGDGKTIGAFSERMAAALAGLPARLSRDQMYGVAVALSGGEKLGNWGKTLAELRDETGALLKRIMQCQAAPRLQALLAVAGEAARRFEAAKRVQGVLDFDDLLRKSVELVTAHPEAVAHYRVIIVDESQDNSGLQNRLIRQVREAAGCIPLVICGDPKQSINTWRGAAADSMRTLARGMEALTVPLQVSHRSQKDLVEVINRLSRSGEVLGAGYTAADDLRLSDAAQATRGPNVEILLPDWEYRGDLSEKIPAVAKPKEPPPYRFEVRIDALEKACPGDPVFAGTPDVTDAAVRHTLEARAVARRVYLLCHAAAGDEWRPPFLWGAEGGWAEAAGRAYRYSDIAILFRTSTPQPAFEEALRELGIPFTTGGKGKGFFFRQEVVDLASVLIWLALPHDDTSFLAVVRSPLVGLSDPALAALSRGEEDRVSVRRLRRALQSGDDEAKALAARLPAEDRPAFEAGRRLLAALRAMAGRTSCVDILRHAIHATGYDAVLAGGFHGVQKLANMRKFLSHVQDEERRENLDLSSLALRLRESLGQVEDPDAVVFDPSENAVRLCTVHSAKGLTFPVVFLVGLGRSTKSDSSLLRLEPADDGGFSLAAKVSVPGATADDEARIALDSSTADGGTAERAKERREAEARRLFYVGITRPRDLLVWSGETSGKAGLWRCAVNAFLREQLESGEDLRGLIQPRSYGEIDSAFHAAYAGQGDRAPADARALGAAEASVVRAVAGESYRLTVTVLAHVPVRKAGESEEAFAKRWLAYRQARQVGLAPVWMRKREAEEEPDRVVADAVETGTRAHAFLEGVSFDGPIEPQAEAFLRGEGLAAVDAAAEQARICAVAEKVTELVKGSASIIREMPFAARFSRDGATVMVDGKIDLLFLKDGVWHIVDYKFTEDGPEELREHYALQLQAYLHAVSAGAGRGRRVPRFEADAAGGAAPFRLHIVAGRKDSNVAVVDIPDAGDEDAFVGLLLSVARMTRPGVAEG